MEIGMLNIVRLYVMDFEIFIIEIKILVIKEKLYWKYIKINKIKIILIILEYYVYWFFLSDKLIF